jgi:hypothetical protein
LKLQTKLIEFVQMGHTLCRVIRKGVESGQSHEWCTP